MNKVYGLRIKKVYFDQILRGEKTVEYRAIIERYRRLGERPESIESIHFHYQQPRRMLADVVSIRIVRTPAHLKNDPSLGLSGQCYAITLTNARLIRR